MGDFGITRDGRLIDLRPMAEGKGVNVWDPGRKLWVYARNMTFGTVTDSIPIDEAEAKNVMETGLLPDSVSRRLIREGSLVA